MLSSPLLPKELTTSTSLIKGSTTVQFSLGAAVFCTENDFSIFVNTHLPLANAAAAAVAVACQCCTDGGSTCGGGHAQIPSDNGTPLITTVQSAGEDCSAGIQLTADTLSDILEGATDVLEKIGQAAEFVGEAIADE